MDILGIVEPGYESVRDAFARGQATDPGVAQLCLYIDGHPVVDVWTSLDNAEGRTFDGDSMMLAYSTTKGVLAICAALLVQSGDLDPDAPVTRYWPEFSRNGKASATVGHLLDHTVGLPAFPSSDAVTSVDMADRERCIAALVEATPVWQPGTTRGMYHAFTFGFLVGEVIRRITGGTEGEFLARELAVPLDLDFWIGLPASEESRVWPRAIWGTLDDPETNWRDAGADLTHPVVRELLAAERHMSDSIEFLNSREGHRAEISAGNGIGNARAVARMFATTIGEVDGVQLLSPSTVQRVTASRVAGLPLFEPLAFLGPAWDRGLGLFTSNDTDDGPLLIEGSFGHPGAGGVQGFANPRLGLSGGYMCSSMFASPSPDPRFEWVAALERVLVEAR